MTKILAVSPVNRLPRRRRVIVLGAALLVLSAAHVWQGLVLWEQMPLIRPLSPAIDPRFRLGLAILWAVVWLGLAGAAWLRRPFVRWAIPGSFFLYTMAQLWLVRAATTPAARAGWPLTAVAGLVAIGYSLWALRT